MAHLNLTGSGTDRKIDLTPDAPLVIGRDKGATLQIDDKRASRLHARVVMKDGDFFVEDLESTNGTLVNEKRVMSHALANGDVVRIGEVRLEFQGGRDPRPALPPLPKKMITPKIDFGERMRQQAKPKFDRPPPKKLNMKLSSGKTRRRSPGGGKGR